VRGNRRRQGSAAAFHCRESCPPEVSAGRKEITVSRFNWSDAAGQPTVTDMLRRNLLITGASGTGKTVATRGIAAACVAEGYAVRHLSAIVGADAPLSLTPAQTKVGLEAVLETLKIVRQRVESREFLLGFAIDEFLPVPQPLPLVVIVDGAVDLMLETDLLEGGQDLVRQFRDDLAAIARADQRLRVALVVTVKTESALSAGWHGFAATGDTMTRLDMDFDDELGTGVWRENGTERLVRVPNVGPSLR
jgi:hypothetical protein